MDIDIRRQNRNDDLVGLAGDLRKIARLHRRGRVHDDMSGVFGDAQLEGARRAAVLLERRDRVNGSLSALALFHPTHGGALWIEIHQDRRLLTRGKVARQVDRESRLARAPLGVQDDDALHGYDPYIVRCARRCAEWSS